jgi:hypothetical protein
MKKITQKEFDKLVKEQAKPAIDACRQNGIKMSAKVIKQNTAEELIKEYEII